MRAVLLLLALLLTSRAAAAEVVVGSKVFTESVVLGEIACHLARSGGTPCRHRRQLGGTRVLWEALLRGDVAIYPEYTGTLAEEIFAGMGATSRERLSELLAEAGVAMTAPLGFDNHYAIAMPRARAHALGLATLSDLARHPRLVLRFSNEFLDRRDGWPALREAYRLPHDDVRGLDHDLAYRGLAAGDFDGMDVYSTDAEIAYYDLTVLADDRGHFPSYEAVFLHRSDLSPPQRAALASLAGRIDAQAMATMNARAKIEKIDEGRVAADFLASTLSLRATVAEDDWRGRLIRHTGEHLFLFAVSLGGAIVVAIPLGVVAARRRRLGQVLLAVVGIIQTIPSLVLLVLMIPLLGIGGPPAIAALFLYSLLPIVRNTHQGLTAIPVGLRESAAALGLPAWAKLWRIELPLASRSILAGIKIAAVINVGTATLGALIGAGGYGQPILTGIRLDDLGLIMEGALPAALLALVIEGLFELFERRFVPRGLRA